MLSNALAFKMESLTLKKSFKHTIKVLLRSAKNNNNDNNMPSPFKYKFNQAYECIFNDMNSLLWMSYHV